MLLFLIGMPGCGKSSVGKELAALMDCKLVDLDAYIVQREKLSIPEIFKTKGEDYFRKAETDSLAEIAEKMKSGVIAVGGGTPCFNNNMQVMQKGGSTIYLKTTPNVLATRIENDENERPLFRKLNGRKLTEKVTSMLEHREKFYKKATVVFDLRDKTPAVIAAELKKLLITE